MQINVAGGQVYFFTLINGKRDSRAHAFRARQFEGYIRITTIGLP